MYFYFYFFGEKKNTMYVFFIPLPFSVDFTLLHSLLQSLARFSFIFVLCYFYEINSSTFLHFVALFGKK